MNKQQRNTRSRGFTLIELIIFIVVVSAGLAGILSVMNTTVKSSADPMVRKQTIAIAESLLEEILLKDYAGSGVAGFPAGSRSEYDCVDNYNGYFTTGGIRDTSGNLVPVLSRYDVSSVAVVDAGGALTGVTAKKITVSVTGPGGRFSLSGYRSSY